MVAGPQIFMPEESAEYLREAYRQARVILEYGAGGSTEWAASLGDKLVFSVESDRKFARDLRRKIAQLYPAARVSVLHVDIGETGGWGRPLSDQRWRHFHDYANAVWDMPFFRHPDLVLVDGRFRTACVAAVLLHAQQPVRLLFDDYTIRPLYHQIEDVVKPVRHVGRLAEFHIEPGMISSAHIGHLVAQYFQVSLQGMLERDYQTRPESRLRGARETVGPICSEG